MHIENSLKRTDSTLPQSTACNTFVKVLFVALGVIALASAVYFYTKEGTFGHFCMGSAGASFVSFAIATCCFVCGQKKNGGSIKPFPNDLRSKKPSSSSQTSTYNRSKYVVYKVYNTLSYDDPRYTDTIDCEGVQECLKKDDFEGAIDKVLYYKGEDVESSAALMVQIVAACSEKGDVEGAKLFMKTWIHGLPDYDDTSINLDIQVLQASLTCKNLKMAVKTHEKLADVLSKASEEVKKEVEKINVDLIQAFLDAGHYETYFFIKKSDLQDSFLLQIVEAYLKKGDMEGAEFLTKYVAKHSADIGSELLIKIIQLYLKSKRLEKALKAQAKLIKISSKASDEFAAQVQQVNTDVVQAFLDAGQLDQAATLCEKTKVDDSIKFKLADRYLSDKEDYTKALEVLSELQEDEDSTKCDCFFAGWIKKHINKKTPEQAVPLIENISLEFSEREALYIELARACIDQQNEEALYDLFFDYFLKFLSSAVETKYSGMDQDENFKKFTSVCEKELGSYLDSIVDSCLQKKTEPSAALRALKNEAHGKKWIDVFLTSVLTDATEEARLKCLGPVWENALKKQVERTCSAKNWSLNWRAFQDRKEKLVLACYQTIKHFFKKKKPKEALAALEFDAQKLENLHEFLKFALISY